ncbi:MAG TPA: endolytic transglycosylase MltG [Kiloniellales bacterium]|nr:endolytic transglycosylase MltG [Kiloniellales bacterium]
MPASFSDATPEDLPPEERPRARPRRRGSFLRSLFILVLLGALAAGAAAWWGWTRFQEPGPSTAETVVIIPKGAGLPRIADLLQEAGVISEDWLFTIVVKALGKDQALKAGEYAIPAGSSMRQVMDLLIAGLTVVHKVTVAEGLSTWEIVQVLNAAPDLAGPPIEVVPAEGTLLPETYFFERGDTRQQILDRMTAGHRDAVARLWPARASGLPLENEAEWIVLASIVEKETGLPDERPLVASVFVNRLKQGMRLQSDPTVIYGITQGQGPLGRGLTRKELDTPTPYNTYTIDGLPPGPIANPGLASLEAVLHPADTKFLYFVADGTGGHVFAETLKEHNENVRKWREIEKQRQQQGN